MTLFKSAERGALYGILKPYMWALPVIVISGIATSALEGLSIGLIVPLLSMLDTSGVENVSASVPRPLSVLISNYAPNPTVTVLCATILALILVKAVVQMANSIFIAWIEGAISAAIRNALARRVLRMDYSVFMAEDKARLVNIVATESWRTSDAVRHFAEMLTSVMAIVVFSIILFTINGYLFSFVVLGLLVLRALQTLLTRKAKVLGARITGANQELAERVILIADSLRPIRMFGRADLEEKRFSTSSEQVRRSILAVGKIAAGIGPTNEIFYGLLFVGVFLFSHALGTSVAVLTAFLVLLYRMQPHVFASTRAWLNLHSCRGAIEEVEWLLNVPGELSRARIAVTPTPQVVQSLAFENVSFAYPGQDVARRAVRDLSFNTGTARVIALLGRSGSGKSTVVNLICSLLTPTQGRILVDGHDLSAIDPQAWRLKIGLAGQDIDLVDGTVAENIAYGATSVTPEQITAVAKMADADSFIENLPNTYQAEVGSRGTKLSGGQRQRIGLARALVRRPALLILDEATNSVDGVSETEIVKILESKDCFGIAVVISHSRKTLETCEYGIVLEDGKIVEEGPLRALEYYKQMKA